MKVAIIEPVGGHGGMNYYDFNLARALIENDTETILYTCDKTQLPEYLTFPIKRTFNEIWGDAPKYYRAVRYIIGLLCSIIDAKLNGIKLLHFHFFHYTQLEKISVILAKLAGFKTVITVHDVESFAGLKDTKLIDAILSMADALISHNHLSYQQIIKKTSVNSETIGIIPHGNYLSDIPFQIDSNLARKKLKLPADGFVLLFFGQIKKVKGLDILLNAMPAVLKEFPNTYLVISGKVWKDDFNQYEKIIEKHKLYKNIIPHIRYIPDNQVPLYYNAANVVVLPYRRIYQSGVLLMAMSYKKAVIASDLDGMTEIVEDGMNGIIFKSEDHSNLAEKIINVIQQPSLLRRIANSGYQTVLHNHNWNLIGQQTTNLYKSVLK